MIDYSKHGVSDREDALILKNGGTTIEGIRRSLNFRGRAAFDLELSRNQRRVNRFYKGALEKKVCYYGPFVGEFGHFLLHNLPFLMHLLHEGVAIRYCGMALHEPFLRDENGSSIIDRFFPLRDFFGEIRPVSNQTVPPADVLTEIEKFRSEARSSKYPFLDISRHDLYWHVLRNWQLGKRQYVYDLSKVYGAGKNGSVVIFPRKKGAEYTENNGGPWDYSRVAKTLSPFFKKVILVGHPSLSAEVEEHGNVEVRISENNADTLKYCSEAELIVTQHSGAVHIGGYVNTPILIIFNGEPPIKGLFDTIRFRRYMTDQPLSYAFNYKEIEEYARRFVER